jgi:hypothetical protein
MPRKRRPWQTKIRSRPVDIKTTIERTSGGPKLTWDREPSSGLGSGAHVVVVAAAAAPVAVAVAAPAAMAVGLTQAAEVVSDLKMVAVEGSRPSARPGLEVRTP